MRTTLDPRQKYQRPRLKIHGAWAFGYTLNVFIMDENAKHDSSAILEILTQTVEDVTRYRKAHQSFHLVIPLDFWSYVELLTLNKVYYVPSFAKHSARLRYSVSAMRKAVRDQPAFSSTHLAAMVGGFSKGLLFGRRITKVFLLPSSCFLEVLFL